MRPSTTSTTKPLHIPTISRVPEKRLDWSVVASLPGSLPEGYSDGGGGAGENMRYSGQGCTNSALSAHV